MSKAHRILCEMCRADYPKRAFATVAYRLSECGPDTVELNLSRSVASDANDLACFNIMCEGVGGPCTCKLARALSRAPSLAKLNLAGNGLTSLPGIFSTLKMLTYLDVSDNSLRDLSVLKDATCLRSLNADRNKLEDLDLSTLQHIPEVGQNPLIR